MKSKLLIFLLIGLGCIFSVSAQDIGEKTYPQQYATVSAYEAASGNSIDSYQEAPMLAERVASGDLPPLAERLPSEPLDSIGQYGGELAGPATDPNSAGWDVSRILLQPLLTLDTDLQTLIPNVARDFEVAEDQTSVTYHLREGHKWSDGEPFTAEDFRFYFEDVLMNEELTPNLPSAWRVGGEPVELEIIDEMTVRFNLAVPQPSFIAWAALDPDRGGFRPAHYFQQFHIDYNPEANDLASELGFENWALLFQARERAYTNVSFVGTDTDPYAPTLGTWVFVSQDAFGNRLFERNSYFFKVDVAGNQLPYADTLRRVLVEDLEVQELRALAGEFTHFGWGGLSNVPTYRDNEEIGNFKTVLVPLDRGNEYTLGFNYNHPDEVMRDIFWDIRFRQALSVAIDRQEINDLVYFGLATPSQTAPVPDAVSYEPWMTDYFAQYDPDLANQLLDEMGLDQRDGDGFRLRPDGETLFINFQISVAEPAWAQMGELITDYWNQVGVKTQYKLIDRGLWTELRQSGQHDVGAWGLDLSDLALITRTMPNMRPSWDPRSLANNWQAWFESDGANGEEPPQEIKDLWAVSEEVLTLPYLSDEWISKAIEFNTMVIENMYMIGTIQRPPQPLIISQDLKNTPPVGTEAVWNVTARQWVPFTAEQWYFE